VSSSLRRGEVSLRPLREEDRAFLLEMVGRPGVVEWWGTPDPPEREWEGLVNDGSAWAIEVGGELAGWLGYHEEHEPDYRSVALDISLAPAFHARGHGRAALRLAARWLVDERGHHRLTIDPDRANARAIRAYAAVGFRPVGILRKANRNQAGEWTDALLMDLLAEELVEDDGTAA
jgi:aminoglycoside 6'-N-acetyltransferase